MISPTLTPLMLEKCFRAATMVASFRSASEVHVTQARTRQAKNLERMSTLACTVENAGECWSRCTRFRPTQVRICLLWPFPAQVRHANLGDILHFTSWSSNLTAKSSLPCERRTGTISRRSLQSSTCISVQYASRERATSLSCRIYFPCLLRNFSEASN
ncbi:hypothetical protein KC19_1G287300 [Ceratodon purpureus]|uniref:Uncharacterized protein n=1 Tax=Ceratodon purpureus TaxID=3225 RepID=A0A8T0JDH5_CERPU|nr:hypothetical protein KC19_1G287300 [Ceratodon purpureus]